MPHHITTLCVVLLVVAGCQGNRRQSPPSHQYGFIMLNRTGEQITDCVLQWGEHKVEFGMGPPNSLKQCEDYDYAFPLEAEVSWRDLAGKDYEARVKVLRRPDRPGDGGFVVCALLPDHTAKIDTISRIERGESYGGHGQYHVLTEGKPPYFFATYNATQSRLSELCVFLGAFQVNADMDTDANSTDSNGGWAFALGQPYEVTDEARVTWRTPDKKEHEAVIDLKSRLPEKLDWQCIVFVIEGDDAVRLTTVPWSTQESWWLNHRP